MKSGLFDDLIEQPAESPSEPTYQSKSGLFQDEVTATPTDYYTKPVASPVITQVEPVKPTFKTFSDLTFKDKAKYGTAKVTKGWYGGSLNAVAGLIESVSTGKDYIKGAFTGSTVAEELAKDSTFDTNLKNLASLYSKQADVTSDELKNTKVSLGLNPDDTFVDQLLQGTGYLTNFIATGVPSKMAAAAIGFGKYAGLVANSLNTASESLMEAQDVYKEAKANGKSDMEAYEASRNTLATNALLIGLTNKVSGVFEDTAFKGIKRMFKVGASGTIEGVQEGLQTMVSNYNTDKPLFQGVKESFLIGAALGVPMAIAFDTGTKQGKEEAQKVIEESDATPEQKQIATDILEGVATEEQKQQAVTNAVTNETFNIPVDETNKGALQADIKELITQGANVGDIVIALQEEGISQNDAENLVAEVIAMPEQVVAPIEEKVVENKYTNNSKKTAEIFAKSIGQEAIKVGDKTYEIGSFGKNQTIRKEGKLDRFNQSELADTLSNEKESYRGSNDETNYRYDNVVHISEMPNGEKRAVYTRLNKNGAEEIINWHKISDDKYIEDLKKNGVPERNRTSDLLVRTEEPYPLGYRYNKSVSKEKKSVKDAAQPVSVTDLKAGTEFENVGTLVSITQPKTKGKKKGSVKYYFKHPDGFTKYYTEKQAIELVKKGYKPAQPRVERTIPQAVDKAKQYGFDNVQYYFDNTDSPETISYYDSIEKDYVGYRTSTAMADFPEHLRDRKLLNEVEPYWYKQTRPEDTGTQASKNRQELYDYLTKQVDKLAKDYTKMVDEQMAREAKGDGVEFKTKEATGTREMAVLDDFKKRYKVQFPTLIVSKIIEGKKTELHPKGDGMAEGATDGNTIALAFDAIINTGKHELIHLTLNNLDQIPELAKFSRQDILKAQAKKMGVELTKENEKTVEEQLALDFEAYQNKIYKPNNSTIAKFFASIRDMINNFRGVIVKSNGDVITQYYDAVLYGETARKQEVAITTESNIAKYLVDNVLDYRPMYQARRVLSLSNGIKSVDFKSSKDKQPEFKEALEKSTEIYKESGDLTTKILKDLEGKTTVSKQYILDATNRGDVKQIEKNIIRDMLFFEGDKVNVKDFAFKVQQELLPLFVKSSDNVIASEEQDYNPFIMNNEGSFTPKYEFVNLPTDLRGDVEGYVENIYESPIKTSAGDVHFNYLTKNYFGHTRIEDMAGDDIRRVIEVQSDLLQRGRLQEEMSQAGKDKITPEIVADLKKQFKDIPEQEIDDYIKNCL